MTLNLDITTFKTSYYRNQFLKENGESMNLSHDNNNADKSMQNSSFSSLLDKKSEHEIEKETVSLHVWDNVLKTRQNLYKSNNLNGYKNFMAQSSYGNLKVL